MTSPPPPRSRTARKHAVEGFTESLREELYYERSNVRLSIVHLPAINTPQFDWVKSRLPFRAQPVPPVFQPEVAARAIWWAAHHDRAELYVGWPVVKSVLADRIAPRLLDRFAAKVGCEAQQTDEPEDPQRRNNLWQPLPGDHGAHGRFDAIARPRSIQLWANTHRELVALAGLAVAGLGLGAARAIRRR